MTTRPAGVTLPNVNLAMSVKNYPYLAFGNGIADDTAAINACAAANQDIYFPPGDYNVSSALVMPLYATWTGSGQGNCNVIATANNVAIIVNGYSTLARMRITKTGTHTTDLVHLGTLTVDASRARLEKLVVDSSGGNGIVLRNGNLGSTCDIVSISNVGHGYVTNIETQNTQAWHHEGYFDVRGNGGDGVHLTAGAGVSDPFASKVHRWDYLIAQQNVGRGFYSGTRSNIVHFYGELNTDKDLYLDVFASGNQIDVLEMGTYTDLSTGSVINTMSLSADYRRGQRNKYYFSGGAGKGFSLFGNDGTPGSLEVEKTAGSTYGLIASNSGANAVLNLTHASYPAASLTVNVGGPVIPLTDNLVNLGAAALNWKQIFGGNLVLNKVAVSGGAGTVVIGGTVATTIGAAGGASVLPASPLGYIISNVAGTQVKIPYYNN